MSETEKPKTTGASFDELLKAFETTEDKIDKRIGIKDKIVLPTPEEAPITVRLLWSQDDSNNPIAVMKKENPKFRGGTAFFMSAEYFDRPGERQLSLSKSLFGSIAAAAREKKLTLDDLPGKVGDISAQYYTSAPIALRKDPVTKRGKVCVKCKGTGCPFCTVTGQGQDAGIATGLQPPTVFNFRFRDDLMNVTGAGSGTGTGAGDIANKF